MLAQKKLAQGNYRMSIRIVHALITRYSVNGAVVQVQVKNSNNNQPSKLALKRCKLDSDREYRTAIVRELRIMSSGHFNLIKLREASVFRNEVWIAMDLMRCSVFAVLCARGLPEDCAIYIARGVSAVYCLHVFTILNSCQ